MTRMHWSILVNPAAGRRGQSAEAVASLVSQRGIDATITTTESADHLAAVTREHVEMGTRGFVAVGGDGTANLVLNAIMKSGATEHDRFALGVVAAGSGSDFVRTFGHSGRIDDGFDRIADPEFYTIDIGHMTGSFGQNYFLNAANAGVGAASALCAAKLPKRLGSVRYSLGFWLSLPRFPVRQVTVTVGEHRFEGEAINIVVANGQFFAGGMNIAPRATLVDGLLDVQVFQAPKRLAFTVMPRVIRGSHLTHTSVRRYVGSSIELHVPDQWPIEADGEVLGQGTVSITTIRGAIDFVT